MGLNIDTDTKVIALLGSPVGHSLSPLMHNASFKKLGLNYIYLAFNIDEKDIKTGINALRALKFRGANVTIPYKEAVIPYLDKLAPSAKESMAVNLIENNNGCLIGHNTDGDGFIRSLEEIGFEAKGRVLFIGAGGAARALASSLQYKGISHIDFLDLDINKAGETAEFIKKKGNCTSSFTYMDEQNFSLLSAEADLIVNTSPIGMYPEVNRSPVTKLDNVKDTTLICDIIYNPLSTRLLEIGKARGLKVLNGLGMFIHQGAISFEILTNNQAAIDCMKDVVYYHLTR